DMIGTFELDGSIDGTVSTTLGAGQDRDDVDFGFRVAADLAISKTATGKFALGSTGTYKITVTNNGPATVGTTTVTDMLPGGLAFRSGGGNGFTCTASGQLVSCVSTTPLAPGAVSFPIEVDVLVAAVPSVVNQASVLGDLFDPKMDNNSSSVEVKIAGADLVLSKTLEGKLKSGSTATYRLDVSNHGPSDTAGPVTVIDELPDGLAYRSADGEGWACSNAGRRVTCVSDTPMKNGESSTLRVLVDVAGNASGTIVNTAWATGPSGKYALPDPVTDNERSAAEAVVESSRLAGMAPKPERTDTNRSRLAFTGGAVFLVVLGGLALLAAGVLLSASQRGIRRTNS
ncbi:MAG TPA: DUF11 domain-containing protein, partial [Microthrixaceae bacterium]|nr:DUF11 domain-containing protein [Microthrixaceae bacterium]